MVDFSQCGAEEERSLFDDWDKTFSNDFDSKFEGVQLDDAAILDFID